MKRILSGLIILVLIVFTVRELGRDIPDIDYRIISKFHNDLLDSIGSKDKIECNYLLIVDSSEVLSAEHYYRVKQELQSEIDREVLDDFEKKNTKSFCYANFFTLHFEYKIIRQKEIDTIFNNKYWEDKRNNASDSKERKKYYGGWTEFYKRYPDACGYRGFSRVALNKKKNKALFYCSSVAGGLAGAGYFVYMGKVNNKWVELKQIEDWIM